MLNSERAKSSCRKNLKSFAMKECGAWIICFFFEIVAQSLQAALDILLCVRRTNLQAYAEPPPTRRQREPLHDRLCRRYQEHGPLCPGETPQYRAPSAGDLS